MENITNESKKVILKLENVSRIYSTGAVKSVGIEGITCDILENEIVSIMGKSGSGKSTLLNVMSTVDRPTEGRIFYYENMISSISEKMAASVRLNEFGFVYQKFHLIPTLNVYDNVCMPVSFSKKKPDYDYIDNILEELGIAEYKKKLPSQLSGGEQQRVAIARAMAHKPCIIFADEPTGNLDSENGNNVIRLLIENAKKYGQTLIYVTHDETLAGLAQRTIYLEDGKLKDKENV